MEVQLGAAAERVTTANSPSIDLNELDDAASVHVLTQNRRTGQWPRPAPSSRLALTPTPPYPTTPTLVSYNILCYLSLLNIYVFLLLS